MKRILQHPTEAATGKKYWRNVEELADTPAFRGWLEREFPQGAAEMEVDGLSRRSFVQLMGASLALAGLGFSGCRRPEIQFAALSKSVEWSIPGKPLYYASAMPRRGGALPLMVTTNDGRPTKIEGNPFHPASGGSTDLQAQATILDLYNPQRSRQFIENGKKSDKAAFEKYLSELLAKAGSGAGLAFLSDVSNSPTRERLKRLILAKFPAAKFHVYDPTGDVQAQAVAASFGPGVALNYNLEKADVLLAVDSDFLGLDALSPQVTRQFARRRNPEGKMNRLYAVENRYTITGGMADHRLRLKASLVPAFLTALAAELGVGGASGGAVPGVDPVWIKECAADLMSARGASFVAVGSRQPVEVQALGFAINQALGNIGTTIVGVAAANSATGTLADLVTSLQAKTVSALVILESNPIYTAPADYGFAELLKSVPDVIHVGLRTDATAQAAKWHVPGTHFLESWDDAMTPDGSYVPVQPMILPLFGGLSVNDILALVAGLPLPTGAELVRATFDTLAGAPNWSKFLQNGFLEAAPAPVALALTGAAAPLTLVPSEGIEVVFPPDYKIQDGNSIDNGWLHELPDPITKLTWDNAALLSRKTADHLGIASKEDPLRRSDEAHLNSDVIKITVNGRSLEVPALVVPGHADDSITLTRGYGHAPGTTGKVGQGVGSNAYLLVSSTAPYTAVATVEKTGKKFSLALTQEHNQMEGRALVREATVEKFTEQPDFAKGMHIDGHIPPNISLYKSPPLGMPEQWGMVIDLNTCTGCSTCTIACQAENNIPIVGKEQVINSREMHWLRIDRYFATGDDEHNETEPEMVMQPMGCQHCENAPCETVCPVNATVHSEDGLNVMAYNRCIGTRYCANNCPFKVRRFNFFNYNERPIEKMKVGILPEASGLYYGPLAPKGTDELTKMQKNPNVTVRIRGVMEKCTYCIQRIEEARITSRIRAGASDKLRIPTDSVQSACMQACPTDAITFGNLKDPETSVAKLQDNPRRYRLLEYLNVRTRTSYLARIRNPNMRIPGAEKIADIFPNEYESLHGEGAPGHVGPARDPHQSSGHKPAHH
ncbi:MAG TPA: TAT-variant-translocated molybdopterin oxidoreductase [Chthoniobacterales bacterium]|jgi:molybdopterin-containing oxidoreductase family iron-sulfur binding subunit